MSFLRASSRFCLFFLVCIFTITLIYGLLLKYNFYPLDLTILIIFIEIDLVLSFFYLILFSLQLVGFKKFVMIVCVALVAFISFENRAKMETVIQKQTQISSQGKGVQPNLLLTLYHVQQFYVDLFFNVFGYPVDKSMTTPEELMVAVNTYRTKRFLPTLLPDPYLCQGKEQDLQTLSFFNTNAVSTISEKKDVQSSIVELDRDPHSGTAIVNTKWARSFSDERAFLEDPQWQTGCAVVAGNNLLFIFSR